MKSPGPEEEEQENEAEEIEEAVPPDFWLIQMLGELFGGPDDNEAE